MSKKEIVDIIKNSVAQGVGREQLISDLIFAGFTYQEIEGAINEMVLHQEIPESFLRDYSKKGQQIYKGPKINKIDDISQEFKEQESSAREILSTYKKRFIIFVASAVGAFLIVSVGLYFYETIPSVVVKKAMGNLLAAKSFSYYFQADVLADKNSNDSQIFNLFSDKNTITSQGVVDVSGDYPKISSQIFAQDGFNADSSSTPFWDVSFLSLNPQSWFFKINSIATTSPQDAQLASQLALGWAQVDSSPDTLVDFIPNGIFSEINDLRNFPQNQLSQLFNLILNYSNVKTIISKGTDTINGSNYYHYLITLNQDGIGQATKYFYDNVGQSSGPLASVFSNAIDIWISKSDRTIYKISYSFSPEISGYALNPKNFSLYLFGFNQNYQISSPAQYNSLNKLIQLIGNN